MRWIDFSSTDMCAKRSTPSNEVLNENIQPAVSLGDKAEELHGSGCVCVCGAHAYSECVDLNIFVNAYLYMCFVCVCVCVCETHHKCAGARGRIILTPHHQLQARTLVSY